MKRTYDSTVARIAGNIMPGLIARGVFDGKNVSLVGEAVKLARMVVAEVERTEPKVSGDS